MVSRYLVCVLNLFTLFCPALGQPLIGGLTEVANKRPSNPVRYLADYLYTYDDESNQIEGQTKVTVRLSSNHSTV